MCRPDQAECDGDHATANHEAREIRPPQTFKRIDREKPHADEEGHCKHGVGHAEGRSRAQPVRPHERNRKVQQAERDEQDEKIGANETEPADRPGHEIQDDRDGAVIAAPIRKRASHECQHRQGKLRHLFRPQERRIEENAREDVRYHQRDLAKQGSDQQELGHAVDGFDQGATRQRHGSGVSCEFHPANPEDASPRWSPAPSALAGLHAPAVISERQECRIFCAIA
jgi:hypothetical protein